MVDVLVPVTSWSLSIQLIGGFSRNLAFFLGAFLVVAWLTWTLTLLSKGQTPGKFLLGLRVVRRQDGMTPAFRTMLFRDMPGRLMSACALMVGYLWGLADKDHQTWHDKLAGTVVVREQAVRGPYDLRSRIAARLQEVLNQQPVTHH